MSRRDAGRYQEHVAQLVDAARSWLACTAELSDEDLAEMLRCVERAQAFGAVLDPTAWRRAVDGGSLERQEKVIRAAIAFRRAIRATWADADVMLEALRGDAARWRGVDS